MGVLCFFLDALAFASCTFCQDLKWSDFMLENLMKWWISLKFHLISSLPLIPVFMENL